MPLRFRPLFFFSIALTFFTVAGASSFSQDAKEDPILARMKKDIFYLASDECEGRGVGTKGLDKAAEYIADQFKKAGLKPGGVDGTYFQPFPFATGTQLAGESTLVLSGPQGQKIRLKQGTDFQVVGSSGPGKVTAPLVFAGYGVTAKSVDYDDFGGIDVKGKVIVTLRRVPRYFSKELPFAGPARDELASLDAKQARAVVLQAAAVILVNDASELPADNLVSSKVTAGVSTVSMPFVHVKRAVIDDIVRSSTDLNLRETEKAIDGDLKPRSSPLTGWTVELDVKVKRTEVLVKNVIGVVEGKGPLANETVVVGAHYDHLGYGAFGSLAPAQKGKIHYGADDNGSGTTSMIELARRFASSKNLEGRRMVFIAFTAEERGLIGSRHYTRVHPLFPLKDTTAMFNLDMVGRLKDPAEGSKSKLLVEGFNTAKGFDDLVTKMNPGFDIVKKNSRGFFSSDQYNFYLQGIPVLFFWTGEHPDYHRPTDTAEKINIAGMKRIADYAEKVVDHLRTEPKRPEYTPVKVSFTPGAVGGGQGPSMRFIPDTSFEGKGVLVDNVVKDGPADKAGMKKGDVIIEMGGKAVANLATYSTIRATLKANVAIEVRVLRDQKEITLKVIPVDLK